MSNIPNFMQNALAGYVMPDEIDDYVEEWHDSNSTQDLHEFLGMGFEEYSLWVSHPDFIDLILACRRNSRPLLEAVNDNVHSKERLAARADDARKLTALQHWIAAQPDR